MKRFFRIYPLFVVAILIEYAFATRASGNPGSVRNWVLQLLLLGDLVQMPGGLGGVEWTLRVEVAFYAYMGVLRWTGLMDRFRALFPTVLIATVLGLRFAPFPVHEFAMFKGYLIYAPFLLVGVGFRLKESGDVSGAFLITLALLVFHQHFTMIARHQQPYMTAHFGALAFVMFATCWALRRSIVATPLVLFVSELTYAVYAFHDWTYELIRDRLTEAGLSVFRPEVQGLIGLFALCAAANRYVEKPAARFARVLMKHTPKRLVLRRVPALSVARP